MLGVTSQTPFTYFANAKDLNFVRGGGGGGGEGVDLVKAVCVFQVNFKFDTKIRETREVSQNL